MKHFKLLFLLFSFSLFAQVPSYYNGVNLTKTGNDLFLELATKIASTHQGIPYTSSSTDTWDVLYQADQDPTISNNVLLVYGYNDTDTDNNNDRTRAKSYSGATASMDWNREHVFAKSLANPSLETDSAGPGTDLHNLKPADAGQNSSRNNRKFTTGSGNSGIISTDGGWYPGDEWKGDVARIVMYMYMRYHGTGTQISTTNCLPKNVGFGTTMSIDPNMVELFLKWNAEDPVSTFEANRNDVIFSYQKNRNPFIDNPYLATLIWGGIAADDNWNLTGSSSDTEAPSVPSNITTSQITGDSANVQWTAASDNVGVYDYLVYLNGNFVVSTNTNSTVLSNLSGSTNYTVAVEARDAAGNKSAQSTVANFTTLAGDVFLIKEDFNNCNNLTFSFYSEASSKNWVCQAVFGSNNSGSVGINGYQEDVPSKDWMITKTAINFDTYTNEKLNFYADAAYGSSTLELVYSADYNGINNPKDFTWTNVPGVTIPTHSNGGSVEEVFTFENIDLSSLTGNVYFAFRYYSNGSPTRWTVDDFEIFTRPNLSVGTIKAEKNTKVFPNPLKDKLTIGGNIVFSKALIYTTAGKLLAEKEILDNQLDVSFLNSGSYLFQFITKEGATFSKLLMK